MRRVVITGMGVVAPNGVTRDLFWDACCEGKSGISPIECFDTAGYPTRIAGEVKDFDVRPFVKERKTLKLMGRNVRFAVAAAHEAIHDAGIDTAAIDNTRMGVCMGSGVVPMSLADLAGPIGECLDENGEFDTVKFGNAAPRSLFPLWLLKHLPNMLSSHIAILHDAQGPCNTITTACAAGTQAIGEAARLIARGDADLMFAGGSDSRLEPLMICAYGALGALSRSERPTVEVSRPFDLERDGFVLGEGAAVLVLEDYGRARRRGASIYAEVTGYGSASDALGITRPDPEGKGAQRAMRAALAEAKVDVDDVDYVNAHGTSTRLNDVMETNAVKAVFGERSRRLPLSSIKSMTGHTIGAAGALEAAAMALTLRTGVLPPTINQTTPDPACDLDYIPNEARREKPRVAISNSFGFGGQNASVVMSSV